MNIIVNKKTIISLILVVMISTIVIPVFATSPSRSLLEIQNSKTQKILDLFSNKTSKKTSTSALLKSLMDVTFSSFKSLTKIGTSILEVIRSKKETEAVEKEKNVDSTTSSNWQNVYLTNYKATDDNNSNYSTAYAGQILEKTGEIVNKHVKVNEKGWYIYDDYVMLAILKDNNGSQGGFEKGEIVEFKYNGITYKGVIADCGGATRKYPTLDVYRTTSCTDFPGHVLSTAKGTNNYISF